VTAHNHWWKERKGRKGLSKRKEAESTDYTPSHLKGRESKKKKDTGRGGGESETVENRI